MWFRNILNAKTRPVRRRAEKGRAAATGPGPYTPKAQLLSQLNRLYLNTGPLPLAQPVGARASNMRRPATEFRDHRQYTPGDDVRYVDWKASARHEHIFIKQGEHQKAAVVTLLIDCSASMGWGDPPRSGAALSLAYALAYLALAHNDRLVVVPVTGTPAGSERAPDGLRPLGPLWGKAQAPLLSSYFQAIRFQGRVDLPGALAGLRERGLSRGGLVLVLSDLLGANDLARGIEALPSPAWNLVFLHLLHPAEIDPALNGYIELQDVETRRKKRYQITPRALETYRRRLQEWQDELSRTCRERKAAYAAISTGGSLEQDIIPQLIRAQVVKRL